MAKEFVSLLIRVAIGDAKQTCKNLTAAWKTKKIETKKTTKKDEDDEVDGPSPVKPDLAPIDWFKDKDVLAEASAIIGELKKKSAQWKGTYKLSFEVNLVQNAFGECVKDLTKLKVLGSGKVVGLKQKLITALALEPKDSIANYQSIQTEISELS
jgi:hypothetical protein